MAIFSHNYLRAGGNNFVSGGGNTDNVIDNLDLLTGTYHTITNGVVN